MSWLVSLRRRSADALAIQSIVLIAGVYTLGVLWWRAREGAGVPSYDIYAAHYPNIIYALRSWRVGHGLLWNSLQNCGQPFLPSTLLGLLYPLHWVFLVVDIDTGFLLLAALHLAIGGVATYGLCRELGLSPAAALCGALTFELGGPTLELAVWLPTSILGGYVWMPLALLCCERILRAPTIGTGIVLGVVLTLELLPGYPQILYFTCQLIVLRVLWEFLTRPVSFRLRVLAILGLGLALPLLLGAAYLLPAVDFARQSVRSRSLTPEEIRVPEITLTWEAFRRRLGLRQTGLSTTFSVIPMAVAALAFVVPGRRRLALFYVLAGALFLILAFDTRLFAWYARLPLGRTFRDPPRLIWITGLTFSVLVALGADALTGVRAQGIGRVVGLMVGALLGTAGFYLLSPSGLHSWELFLVGAVLLGCAGAGVRRACTRVGAVLLPLLVLLNLLAVSRATRLGYLKDGRSVIYDHAAAFKFLRERLTAQDRVYQFGKHLDYSLMPKSASVFGVRSITDYEPQTSRRYAELSVWLLRNQPMANLNDFMYRLTVRPTNRALLDLLATRYLLVDRAGEGLGPLLPHSLKEIWRSGSLVIYENPRALPRAFFVPEIQVVTEPATVLRLLAGGHDPRRSALVEKAPADGFLGRSGGTGTVAILEDRDEVVTLRVQASEAGFLFLSDQDYPSWGASVNGRSTPILRANYAFRLVRVPAGESVVQFTYRPHSLRVGTVISVATLLLLGLYGLFRVVTRQASAPLVGDQVG